jgi:hypothetical protein
MAIFLLGIVTAHAHRSPANCGGGGVGLRLSKFRLNGSTANVVTNGEQLLYVIEVQNDSQLPTPSGNVPACDVTCASIIFYSPDALGNPGPPIVLATNVNLPFGTPPFTAGSATCTVLVATSSSIARARAELRGVGHDLSIPGCSPDATCETNPCDPDAAAVSNSVSVYVMSPGFKLSLGCVSATNLEGALSFNLSGYVTNSGDETLTNISLMTDFPAPNSVLTNIDSLEIGVAVVFSTTITNTNNSYAEFVNEIRATAMGSYSGVTLTDKAACLVKGYSPRPFLIPKLGADGSMLLMENLTPGKIYILQTSTDLLNWSSIKTNTALSDTIVFTDTNAPNVGSRFYRAVYHE